LRVEHKIELDRPDDRQIGRLFAFDDAADIDAAWRYKPVKLAQAQQQIERELKKSPDFQLYIVAKSQKDRWIALATPCPSTFLLELKIFGKNGSSNADNQFS
jgi:hypothetical protein